MARTRRSRNGYNRPASPRTGRLPTSGVGLAALAVFLLLALGVVALLNRGDDDPAPRADRSASQPATTGVAVSSLPREVGTTLRLIDRGGPFPYSRDGVAFGNRERRLPQRPRGYYREYTVRTPGSRDRGARRVVSGASGERWYTADHYASFVRLRWPERR